MVNKAFSPKVICMTPSSQPMSILAIRFLEYHAASASSQTNCLALITRETGGQKTFTFDDLSSSYLHVEDAPAGGPRAIKSIRGFSTQRTRMIG